MKRRFEEIYAGGEWGSSSRSGPGSVPSRLGAYLDLLQAVLEHTGACTVVDLGCGDWSFSRYVDWGTARYVGLDVVPSLIEKLNATYGSDSIRFELVDEELSTVEEADLLIAKDVLQHWSNEAVHRFLRRLHRFRHALLVNDVAYERRRWSAFLRYRPAAVPNSDTVTGGYRPLDLTKPPFGLEAERLLRFQVHDGFDRFTKDALLWTNPSSARG